MTSWVTMPNGLRVDLDNARAKQRAAVQRQIEKQRAKLETTVVGKRVTVRRPPQKPLRARKPQRAADERTYSRMRGPFLEVNPLCARCQVAAATEVHHKQGRLGALLLDVTRWLGLCRSCHRWVTEHPREAIEQGYSLPRIGRAA